ncbi:CYTH and CHAD domain-containing protein [Janthinobacterium fluminis]|uniref:CHAD domain-containing protein n=1 Tax=Janthinobacterium fluminis TaxID=2987524 RepID=A0ABT5JVA0_9BURK|nr:CYTH and CHAD domain-containing protein [Janthinobacterium fluminis]MDC8756667.1 CHAD domain-containing protein [Janthinobacterium fluminis]
MEIELKLLLDPADRAKLRRHPLLKRSALGPPQREQMLSIYFDTPDFHLLRHRAGLRVRKSAGQWTQTMKAGGGVLAGLHQRHEWEGPVKGAEPDLAGLRQLLEPGSPWAAALAAPELQGNLQALFTVHVQRDTWNLDVDGAAIELVLDEGSIERNGVALPICEIELELKSGPPERLFELALRLLERMPLRLEHSNKAERGYALCVPAVAAPARAQALQLGRRASVEEGLRAILGNCLVHIEANQAGAIRGDDTEYVHQMRVGVRRLRSALALFAAVAPCPAALRDDIAWLSGVLGEARDWDVLAASTLEALAAAPDGAAQLARVRALLQTQRQQRHAQAAQALQSARYTGLMLSLGAWLTGAGWRLGLAAASARRLDLPLRPFADASIARLHRRALKRGGTLRGAGPRALHRLRGAVKSCHYAAQFFAPLHKEKRVDSYLAAVAAMQDELGWRNDLAVANELLQQLAAQDAADIAALGYARGYLLARLALDRRGLRKCWRALRVLAPPGQPR